MYLGRRLVLLSSIERLELHCLQQKVQLCFAVLRRQKLPKLDLRNTSIVNVLETSSVRRQLAEKLLPTEACVYKRFDFRFVHSGSLIVAGSAERNPSILTLWKKSHYYHVAWYRREPAANQHFPPDHERFRG